MKSLMLLALCVVSGFQINGQTCCDPPVWTPVSMPTWYSYLNSQAVQPQSGTYSYYWSNETIGWDGHTTDGTYPSGTSSPPSPPWWWAGCQSNGSCSTDLKGTNRDSVYPEARNEYSVTNGETSLYFRGFEFYGSFKYGSLPNTVADAAVFYSNGFHFSGGMEYGFRLTTNNASNALEFYYAMNANCGCGGGLPCSQTSQCKATDASSGGLSTGALIKEIDGSVPLPAGIHAGTDYYFHAWIWYDSTLSLYALSLDVLNSSFTSLCTGEPCGNPITMPGFSIPTAYSWGNIYALVKKVENGTAPPSPLLMLQTIKVGK